MSEPVRIRLSDVAAEAGVSLATASKALNGTGRMTDQTRDRVKQAADRLGFRPNAMARALIRQRSMTVGLLTNDSYGRFTMPVMAGVAAALVDEGISVFMCNIEDDAQAGRLHLDAMLDKQVDGIILTGKRIDTALPVDLEGLSIPVVHVFTKAPPDTVSLVSDDAQGAGEAVRWIAGLGRQRLAHVTGPADFASVAERARAFAEVAGPDAPVLHGPWSEAWGHEAVDRLWRGGGTVPDGIFCGNDQIARGVIDALRERGVDVPGDVSVVGFDNWDIVAAATRPPLTSVDMNLKALGREAGRLIRALAEGQPVAPGLRRMPCRLVVRRSCGGGET
ncbi:LacI family DNA-binding transcriptional regulator [Marinibacterium sp. SX1]|uniref:LacI family DNA-binding transcriptional regulator n=1 Tax=Marinibacterium sp. SX1 TaxID=3388424 RepID=UPI003D183151